MQDDAGASKTVLFCPQSPLLMLPEATSGVRKKGRSPRQENTEGDHSLIFSFPQYRLPIDRSRKKKSLNTAIPNYDYLVALDILITDRLFLGLKMNRDLLVQYNEKLMKLSKILTKESVLNDCTYRGTLF